MIKRVVKMTFEPSLVQEFLMIFEDKKEMILASDGCRHLELLQDKNDPAVFFTYSFWDTEEDLNAYRHSDLFKSTWSHTRQLFADKPSAWTLETVVEVLL